MYSITQSEWYNLGPLFPQIQPNSRLKPSPVFPINTQLRTGSLVLKPLLDSGIRQQPHDQDEDVPCA